MAPLAPGPGADGRNPLKTLILYDTRHGFTDRCLQLLVGELPAGADLWPVRQRPGIPDWTAYDAVLVGGPVYFGRWSPRLQGLVNRHARDLAAHPRVGAFVVSLSPRAAALKYLDAALPADLVPRLGHVACFGGGVTWAELAWWERALLKANRGIETDASNLDLGAIQGLAAWLTGKPATA